MTHPDRAAAIAVLAVAALAGQPVFAKAYEVKMLNKGATGAMVFEPALVKVAPGDTVTFVPTDKGHNALTLPDLVPAGALQFSGKLNEALTVTLKTPGLYVYKCLPHYFMGMVGIIQVGRPANRNAVAAGIAKTPPIAKKRLTDLLAQIK